MDDRTRYIPSIVMLSAALVSCVATIIFRYETKEILLIVLGTSIVFFIIGLFIRRFALKYLVVKTVEETIEEQEENKKEASGEEGGETSEKEKP